MALSLPSSPGPHRENAILEQVAQGNYEVEWATITSSHKGRTAEFWVFADALKIEGVRINVSAKTEQLIADSLGCMLLTPKLADLIWSQRIVTLPPLPRVFSASTQAMIEHSQKVDGILAKQGNPLGLKATVGKHWVIDNDLALKPHRAMNYGWHFEGKVFQGQAFETCATGLRDSANGQIFRMIQGRGTRHDMNHSDYSQTCVLVHSGCKVDGVDTSLKDLLQNPDLAPLASHQGVMKIFRQPGA